MLKIVSVGPNNVKRVIGAHWGEVQRKQMSCTRPLVRTEIQGEMRVIGMETFLTRYGPQYQFKADEELQKFKEIRLKKLLKENNATLIPCGHCAACKLTASSSWANRMEMELPYHENAWFVTLTYDDEHVPWSYNNGLGIDKWTGEVIAENLTLNYKDMQDFWKRLRRYREYHQIDDGQLMYFQAGEYGGKTHRPHYHAIVYDLNIKKEELKEYKRKNGVVYYNCDWLTKIWGNGHVVITEASWKAFAYTARYTTKKVYGSESKDYYLNMGILPEKCVMSKKPAIGMKYYEEHKEEIYKKDNIQLKNGRNCKPPRYFDKLFDLEHIHSKPLSDAESEEIEETTEKAESEELKAIKRERRRIANDALFAQLKQTGLTMQEYYNLKDGKIQERMKKLIREEI